MIVQVLSAADRRHIWMAMQHEFDGVDGDRVLHALAAENGSIDQDKETAILDRFYFDTPPATFAAAA